jgi:acetyl-CoA synthetase
MFHIKSKLEYNQQYQASISDFKNFWKEISRSFFWFKEPTKISNCDLAKGEIKWFEDGQTNIAYNCLDRHLKDKSSDPLTLKIQRGICNEQPPLKKEVALRETQGRRIHDKVAIIWEANNPNEEAQKITYRELHQKTCQFANLLVARGIKKGDRVAIYMPMIPESVVAMLACARIGAVHLVVFAGFSAKALAQRMVDSGAKMLITADFLYRGEKEIELLDIALEALQECDLVEEVVVYQRDDVLHERVDGVANSVQRNMQCTTEVANSIQRKKEKESWTEFVIPSTHSCQKENYKILYYFHSHPIGSDFSGIDLFYQKYHNLNMIVYDVANNIFKEKKYIYLDIFA